MRQRPGTEGERNPEDMFRQQMQRREQQQKGNLDELKKILETAKEENAFS